MILKKVMNVIAIAATCSLLAMAFTYAEGLTLSLSVPKPKLVQWEPIPFNLTLQNRSPMKARVQTSLALNSGTLKMFVIEPDGSKKNLERLSPLAGLVNISEEELMPNEKLNFVGL